MLENIASYFTQIRRNEANALSIKTWMNKWSDIWCSLPLICWCMDSGQLTECYRIDPFSNRVKVEARWTSCVWRVFFLHTKHTFKLVNRKRWVNKLRLCALLQVDTTTTATEVPWKCLRRRWKPTNPWFLAPTTSTATSSSTPASVSRWCWASCSCCWWTRSEVLTCTTLKVTPVLPQSLPPHSVFTKRELCKEVSCMDSCLVFYVFRSRGSQSFLV